MGVMYLHTIKFFTLADTTSIHMGAMYVHARMFCTRTHTFFIPIHVFIHARTFFTFADTTYILMGAMYLHARTFCTLSDKILYPLWAQIFTVITEVWPCANRAMVTNNLTVIIEVFLYINLGG